MAARSLLVAVFAALSITICASGVVWSADQAANCGVVDMERIRAEYRQMQELNQEFQQFQWEQDRQLQERHKTRMLTDEERQEYEDLSAMAAPTETRAQRLKELEASAQEREKRLFELREKEERTEEEAVELEELDPLYERRMRELAALQAELHASRRAKLEELSTLLQDNLENAVKQVAEERELALVLARDSVLYGATDITDAVLEKLNAEEESVSEE
jgi:Skp family chaperone for outer membrane proteins